MSENAIAIDAMGGDHAPSEIVKGAVDAANSFPVKIILIGEQESIANELAKYTFADDCIDIINAPEVIGFNEVPTTAIKTKKNSSIVVGLNLLKNKKADAFVSAGSTGALLTGATIIVGRIKGIERPALATVLPNKIGFSFLLDCGANVDAKPSYLVQYAKMGSLYMENILNVPSPKVGLVNIGEEKEKGNILTKEAYDLIQKSANEKNSFNFIGNIEARDIALGKADVIVCDAFVGNVILKHSEGLSSALLSIIKSEITASFFSKIAAFFLKPAFKRVLTRFDYSEYGGAPFLGLNSLVIKAHGSSDAKMIKNTVKQSLTFVERDIIGKIEKDLIYF